MSGIPTVICYVHDVRNSGTPTGRESYGVGVLVVVDGVTPIQGERESRSPGKAGQVNEVRGKNEMEGYVMLLLMSRSTFTRTMVCKNHQTSNSLESRLIWKLTCPVRRG
ncbi:MAG: hypothetical protein GY799_19900 [Desulfobulbaceae bacterium]|nr:hypothetical protein [Desulfobulbaceae bacterium]